MNSMQETEMKFTIYTYKFRLSNHTNKELLKLIIDMLWGRRIKEREERWKNADIWKTMQR